MTAEGYVLVITAFFTGLIGIVNALKANNKANTLSEKHDINAAEIEKIKNRII